MRSARLLLALTAFLTACGPAVPAPTVPPPASATPGPTSTLTSTPALTVAPTAPPSPTPTPSSDGYFAGWAVVAYPDQSQAEMETMLQRLKDAGANVVWIGHNNPGEVTADKREPGLSYAVYAAARDPASPDHATALAVIDAEHRMLRAARAVGLPAVFPIGYQIQMGLAWRDAHPKLMRHDAAGQWLSIYNGGVSASPYTPEYQSNIRAYYEWVWSEFVQPYRDVIQMLNLADEPLGGDYSAPAEAQFMARTGFTFADAPAEALGAFQDRVVVDYAAWSARQWLGLAPDLPVTMSFCGAQGRWSYRMPDVEALFRDTPPNFVPTFDAYLHDYLPWEPMTEAEAGSLALFARTLGDYSARYNREMWLWPAGNRWGLAGYGSSNPGGVSDAMANGYLLALAARSTGGHLRGLAVWAYNVRDQGLYGDDDPAPYNRDVMFTRLSAAFDDWRHLMAAPGGQARMLILLSDTMVHTYLGATRNAVMGSPLAFDRLVPLTRSDVPAAVVGAVPPLPLAAIQTVLITDPTPETLSTQDRERLHAFAEDGGRVIATGAVLAGLWPGRDVSQGGSIGAGSAAVIPADSLTLDEAGWATVLSEAGLSQPGHGLRVSAGTTALWFQPGAASVPLSDAWRVFDRDGARRKGALELGPHEFALSP